MLKLLVVATLAQAAGDQAKDRAPNTEAAKQRAAERLEFMKKSVAVYELTLADGSDGRSSTPHRKAMLVPEPLLRWSNIHGDEDGTLVLWRAAGRPVAIAQVFSVDKGKVWLHEFQSLSEELFSLERDGRPVWTPSEAGLEFKTLADAPVPAKTEAQRLFQMHALSRRFAASDDYGNNGNLWQLRLLSRPVYRYAKDENAEAAPETRLIDGAIFAYVVGTDPEMLLLLEARRGAAQSAWHYALAPMTCFAFTATLDGKAVWSCPFRGAPYRPRDPFFSLDYRP
ncbi:MAG: hypothetical protein ACREHD_34075 [Pirellulales bacterium]